MRKGSHQQNNFGHCCGMTKYRATFFWKRRELDLFTDGKRGSKTYQKIWNMRHRIEPELAAREAECRANINLRAAAPDLYEALKMVADADSDCCADGLSTIPPAARAKIDAALAKARGES